MEIWKFGSKWLFPELPVSEPHVGGLGCLVMKWYEGVFFSGIDR